MKSEEELKCQMSGDARSVMACDDELACRMAKEFGVDVILRGSMNLVHASILKDYGERLLELGFTLGSAVEGFRFDGRSVQADLALILEVPEARNDDDAEYLSFLEDFHTEFRPQLEDEARTYFDVMPDGIRR